MDMRSIMIVGAGQMGSGIAQVAAQSGYKVLLCDLDQSYVARALANIEKLLGKSVEKGKISESDKLDALSRIAVTSEMDRAAEVDLVI